MVARDDFTPLQWEQLKEGPIIAGVLIVLASPNIMGIPKESVAMMKAVKNTEASGAAADLAAMLIEDLDDEESSSSFEADGTADETTQELLERLAAAVAIVDERCDVDVAAGYRAWVSHVARVTAEASKEGSFLGIGGTRVTDEETEMLSTIDQVLGR